MGDSIIASIPIFKTLLTCVLFFIYTSVKPRLDYNGKQKRELNTEYWLTFGKTLSTNSTLSDKISAFPRKLASHNNSIGKKGDKEVNKTKAREK